jgi:hypothetical protein
MASVAGVGPYAVLGILVEGAAHTFVEHIPRERQAEAVATLKELLNERLRTYGVPGGKDRRKPSASRGSDRRNIAIPRLGVPPQRNAMIRPHIAASA